MQAKDADARLCKRWPETFVPAMVLLLYKIMGFVGHEIAFLEQSKPVGSGLGVTIFNLLHQASDAHFEEFIEIAGTDGE